MLVLPAIDLRGGRCVRLLRGDYDQETVFGDDPGAMARRWLGEGARAMHIVDLDGARDGAQANAGAVAAILAAVADAEQERGVAAGTITTELGGGIRDLAGVRAWLDAGLGRVILGTAAVRQPELVGEAAAEFPGRVWVGIDARDGKVSVAGWREDTELEAAAFAKQVADAGAGGIVYTDIARDGTGDGVNAEATARIADVAGIPVVASGGVHSCADVERLLPLAGRGIAGVIVGRALYDGAVTLAELEAAAGA